MAEDRVHVTHCCKRHGCKYGDKDCPVANGRLEQQYPCESCDDPDIQRMESDQRHLDALPILISFIQTLGTSEARQCLRKWDKARG